MNSNDISKLQTLTEGVLHEEFRKSVIVSVNDILSGYNASFEIGEFIRDWQASQKSVKLSGFENIKIAAIAQNLSATHFKNPADGEIFFKIVTNNLMDAARLIAIHHPDSFIFDHIEAPSDDEEDANMVVDIIIKIKQGGSLQSSVVRYEEWHPNSMMIR